MRCEACGATAERTVHDTFEEVRDRVKDALHRAGFTVQVTGDDAGALVCVSPIAFSDGHVEHAVRASLWHVVASGRGPGNVRRNAWFAVRPGPKP